MYNGIWDEFGSERTCNISIKSTIFNSVGAETSLHILNMNI